MAAPKFRVRLFQLEVTGMTPDIAIVTDSEQVYETEGSSNDFNLISAGDLDESLEFDEGIFRFSSIPITVEGLDSTYFNAYDDVINMPFVCVIEDITDSAAEVVMFHGPIDRETAEWNATNNYTSFEVLSWDYLLDQAIVPARTVFECETTRAFTSDYGAGFPAIFVPRYVNGYDMDTTVVQGDVVIIENDAGESRIPVVASTVDSDDVAIELYNAPAATLFGPTTIAAVDVTKVQISPNVWGVAWTISDGTLWTTLDDYTTNPTAVFLDFDIPNKGLYSNVPYAPEPIFTHPNRFDTSPGSPDTDFVLLIGLEDEADDIAGTGFDVTIKTINEIDIDTGTRIKVLGREIYGDISGPGTLLPHSAEEVIENLFSESIAPSFTGVLRYIVNTYNYPTAWATDEPAFSKSLEYPFNLLESLRLIANTVYCFVRFDYTLDGSDLPRLTVNFLARDEADDADVNGVADVVSYTERATSMRPPAVVVRPFADYSRPSRYENVEIAGFWYDGVDTADPLSTGRPKGPDVIEIEVNVVPSYTGTLYTGDGDLNAVLNDGNLIEIAKRFYDFYDTYDRTASVLLDQFVTSDKIGEFIQIDEGRVPGLANGALQRDIFLMRRVYNMIERQTQCEGRLGTFSG